MRFSVLVLLAATFLSCEADTAEFLAAHPKSHIDALPKAFDQPWHQRILRVQNSIDLGLDTFDPQQIGRFYGYNFSEEEEQQLKNLLRSATPQEMDALMNKHFIGLFPLFGPGTGQWSAYAKPIIDSDGNPYFLLGFNMGILKEGLSSNANDWLQDDEGWNTQTDWTTELGVKITLFHEVSHGLDYLFGFTVDRLYIKELPQPFGRRWSEAVWLDLDTPKPQFQLSQRRKYFNQAVISAKDYIEILQELEDSPYISFYGTTNAQEDFAEHWEIFAATNFYAFDNLFKYTSPEGTVYEFAMHIEEKQLTRQAELGEIYQWIISQDYAN